jgi:hypothetical protein
VSAKQNGGEATKSWKSRNRIKKEDPEKELSMTAALCMHRINTS